MSIVELKQNEISDVAGGIGFADKCGVVAEYTMTALVTFGFMVLTVVKRDGGKKTDGAATSLTRSAAGVIFSKTTAISLVLQGIVGAPLIFGFTKLSQKIGEWLD